LPDIFKEFANNCRNCRIGSVLARLIARTEEGMRELQVLMVEDEPWLRDLLTEVLTEQGLDVRVATNAASALAQLEAGTACDVLFTDINLGPGADGVALSVAARKLRPDLPVVYSSGSVASLRELRAVSGASFVAKPCDFDRLGETLRAAARELTTA
jgi:DNA-binding NtrC family response regulator